MRGLFLICAVIAGLSGPALSQSDDIRATIGSQIEAFQADDFARAFTYASPDIRRVFRTPENFGAMVRGGYPMVWRPSDVRFLELREIAGALWQKVMVTDAKGRVHILDYQMIEIDGGWKINGVQLVQAGGANA
ncbi:DUF4864 domain-containing protein [Sedimentitalea sp. JM2-8]|uniref:DUF4864 domain-containing protein n=1 Tax=Sedimentitalea xiamensis TaxID=3050037 RepID=A0ABT7FLC4_9RHOB|nr:DUF4864 domain-containing protein [Sedimentitalea xiamensis]MDK3075524.1 DUF4864 domain-containing protein [Sedimentitalea xiamensis]